MSSSTKYLVVGVALGVALHMLYQNIDKTPKS